MATTIPMLDLMFFLTENQANPRHVGAILILQKPKRGGACVVEEIVEAYRQAVPVPPFNRIPVFRKVGLPEWRDVTAIDMHWHVQHLALPTPGTEAQLNDLVAELHGPMLERDRPGWRLYVIDGLQGDRFAVFTKVHHALMDGESGLALLERSMARSARDKTIRTVVETSLPAHPKARRRRSLLGLERQFARAARAAVSVGWGSNRLAKETLSGLMGFSREKVRPFTAPMTPMNEPIRNERSVARTVLPLSAMKAVARAWDATLNDVALCVLDAAMNRYLRGLGHPPAHPLVTICPVSLREAGVQQATTAVSAFWAPLGAPRATIARRMRQVMANTQEAKERMRTLPKDAAYAYAVLIFAMGETLALVPRGQEEYFLTANVLISNVRGPARPLYLNGARLEVICPVSTLLSGMGLNITLISYSGRVVMGFTANASALPQAGLLAQYAKEAFAALQRADVSAESPARRLRPVPAARKK
jgi:WS/DGAT/MGAT family acyltransferase